MSVSKDQHTVTFKDYLKASIINYFDRELIFFFFNNQLFLIR